jgi:hypothetical protein
MHATPSRPERAEDQRARQIAEATTRLMRELDAIERRLNRLESTLRDRVATDEPACTLH